MSELFLGLGCRMETERAVRVLKTPSGLALGLLKDQALNL